MRQFRDAVLHIGDSVLRINERVVPVGDVVPRSRGTRVSECRCDERWHASLPDGATWSGSCRQLVVPFVDGTRHIAGFQFK